MGQSYVGNTKLLKDHRIQIFLNILKIRFGITN